MDGWMDGWMDGYNLSIIHRRIIGNETVSIPICLTIKTFKNSVALSGGYSLKSSFSVISHRVCGFCHSLYH